MLIRFSSRNLTSILSSNLHSFLYRRHFSFVSNLKKMDKRLVWIDCEMTGLDVQKDRLLEIAAVITDHNLNKLDSFDSVYISTPKEVLDSMNDWCKEHFKANGLINECLKSNLDIETVDTMLDEFIKKNNVKNGLLAGNSIAFDRYFLNKYCPKFVSNLHYRMVDVSSIKMLVNMWVGDEAILPKKNVHRAMDDINESIQELAHYRSKYFNC